MGFIRKLSCKVDLPKFNLPDFSKLTIPSHIPGTQSILGSIKQPNMEMRDGGLVNVKKISAQEFLNTFYKTAENFHLGSSETLTRVTGHIKFDQNKFHKKYGIFENFEFENSFILMGESEENLFSLGESIIFINCRFEKKLFIQNCEFEEGKTELGSYEPNSIEILGGFIKEISIEKCTLHGVLFSKFDSEFLKLNRVNIENCTFLKGSISLDETEIQGMCDINFNTLKQGSIRFVNNKAFGGCRLSVNKIGSLHFYGTDSIFEKPVFIYHGEYRSIDFNDIQFNDEVTLIACSIEEEIKLTGNTFEDRIWILSKDDTNDSIASISPKEMWIQNNKFQNGFKYNSQKNTVEYLFAIFSEKSSGVIEFEEANFENVDIIGSNFNNSLFFRDCHYSKIKISNFFNKALVSFNNNFQNSQLTSLEEFTIENSNLGNTEFYDFDFSLYPTIRIIDSRLDNIFFNGVEWFEPSQLKVDESETNPKKILTQKREIYRQLKLAAEKQSDRITALEFKAKEVETHRLYLELGKVKKADRWAILAGTTNNHGQDWIKPLWSIILISLGFFFPLFFIADPEINFWPDVSKAGWNFFWSKIFDHSKVIPQLFNPARRVSDMFEVIQYPFWVYFLDGFHRIILAFFIFQIVSAFRKFVK